MTEGSEPELPFEAAVGQLEAIVESLEQGEPSLAAALEKYENGIRLLAHCYGVLERAERSVAVLTGVDAEGRPTVEPFNASATLEADTPRPGKRAAEKPAPPAQASAPPAPGPTPAPKPRRRARPPEEPEPDPFDPPF